MRRQSLNEPLRRRGLIIGVSGKKRSGKDTLAKFIRSAFPGDLLVVHFADPLKEVVANRLGISIARLELAKSGKDSSLAAEAVRRLLQETGDVYRKQFGRDVWVRLLERKWAALGYPNIIVPDVRMPWEAEWVLSQGGVLIRRERPDRPTSPTDSHPTETALDGWDRWDWVVRTSSLEELERIAKSIARALAERAGLMPATGDVVTPPMSPVVKKGRNCPGGNHG